MDNERLDTGARISLLANCVPSGFSGGSAGGAHQNAAALFFAEIFGADLLVAEFWESFEQISV